MRTLGPLMLLAGLVLATPALRQTANPEEAAVRAAVEHYLRGHATGDGKHHEIVFHPESKLYWIADGALASRSSAEYIAGAAGQPAANEAQRRRRIAMVDVTGDAAVAKVELDYPDAFITDYFTLLKVNGEWKIMNKIFTRVASDVEMPAVLPLWLVGCWETRSGRQVTLERWAAPSDAGLMVGTSRAVDGGSLTRFDQLELRVERGRLIFTTRATGRVRAVLVSTMANESGFTVTNAENEYAQKIVYTRVGADSLVTRLEGPGRESEVTLKRMSCSL